VNVSLDPYSPISLKNKPIKNKTWNPQVKNWKNGNTLTFDANESAEYCRTKFHQINNSVVVNIGSSGGDLSLDFSQLPMHSEGQLEMVNGDHDFVVTQEPECPSE
jgi:hypothetical protein